MDSGNEAIDKNENLEPNDGVVPDLEAKSDLPQSLDNEDSELFVDVDSDNQKESHDGMTQAQAYAAFQKEKRKRKEKQSVIDAEKKKSERLEAELAELKSKVNEISRGEMPDPFDFDDKVDYYKAVKEWEGQADQPSKSPEKNDNQADVSRITDEAEFFLFQKEQEVQKSFPTYNDSKKSLMDSFRNAYGVKDPDKTMAWLSDIAKEASVDIAKAVIAMDKMPSIVRDLDSAQGNRFAVARILEKAAGRVKARESKKIDSLPEPDIKNSGPVDSSNAAVEKLRKQWVEKPNTANYEKYKQAKQKLKDKVDS